MAATILDSRFIAGQKRDDVKAQIADFKEQTGISPGLVIVCVGDDPSTYDYIRSATAQARKVGIRALAHVLSGDLSQDEVIEHLHNLNGDPKTHAIALQTPLPAHINLAEVTEQIHPDKDVEGYHPANAGQIRRGSPRLIPPPAQGAMQLMDAYNIDPSGMSALIVGRNAIIGRPLASLLMELDATVSVGHRQTTNLPALIAQADLLVLGASMPGMISVDMLKPGVVILDYGINYVPDGEGEKIVGNVDFEEALPIVGAITPMPGGTGPMTTVSLLQNTLKAAKLQAQA